MSKLVKVYPVSGYFLLGVASIPADVPPERAAELCATGAFTTDPPPEQPADKPTEARPMDGPSDSTEVAQ